jgi:two-component system cell cycle sensor histidine kinase/response regulator CckA
LPYGQRRKRVMEHKRVILTVDDNSDVLHLLRRILLRNGFHVQVAADGLEGLDCFHKHRDELCLVITDIVMPKMNGLELARAIREIDADVPVLLISGHSESYVRGDSAPEFPLVRKPFSAADLLKAVDSAVN